MILAGWGLPIHYHDLEVPWKRARVTNDPDLVENRGFVLCKRVDSGRFSFPGRKTLDAGWNVGGWNGQGVGRAGNEVRRSQN